MEDKIIMLVEDNPDDVELTQRALKSSRILNELVVARDGVEALDYLFCTGSHAERNSAICPELIILDLKLPKLDGLQVLQQIRSNPRTRLLPVVILTSSVEDQDLINGYGLGANSYLRKPVDFEKFVHAIQQLELYWLVLNQSPPRVDG